MKPHYADGMTTERYQELLRGALWHPLMPFVITRLTLALWHVVDATGLDGAIALEQWCAARDEQDRRNGE